MHYSTSLVFTFKVKPGLETVLPPLWPVSLQYPAHPLNLRGAPSQLSVAQSCGLSPHVKGLFLPFTGAWVDSSDPHMADTGEQLLQLDSQQRSQGTAKHGPKVPVS